MAHVISRFSRVRLFVTSWTVAHQAPLSTGVLQARLLEWEGDLPNTGIEPVSLMSPVSAGGFFTTSATWEAQMALAGSSPGGCKSWT